ncbi:MAG: DHH family phosphoesterase [Chloroflexi bacterium]|nr:DHH family phosphoesterase [Chloroflexota bacterium]
MTTSKNNSAPLVQLEWDKAAQLVAAAQTIAVVTHLQPDGDAIGSMMGVTLALRNQGKHVTPYVEGGLPKRFAFVPSSADIRDTLQDPLPDLIISTDSSDKERLGTIGASLLALGRPLIQLDHHQTNLSFGDVNLVDARTAAASEGVLDWLDQLGIELTADIAQALITGLVTDTLCFRTSNVSAHTLQTGQRLIAAGADMTRVVQLTLARIPTGLMRLQAMAVSRMQLEDGLVWATIDETDLLACGMQVGDYTGLSGHLIQTEDARLSASFTVLDGDVECSFRSIPGYSVAEISLALGGGGHVAAGGATLRGVTLEQALARVLPMLKAELARGKPVYSR